MLMYFDNHQIVLRAEIFKRNSWGKCICLTSRQIDRSIDRYVRKSKSDQIVPSKSYTHGYPSLYVRISIYSHLLGVVDSWASGMGTWRSMRRPARNLLILSLSALVRCGLITIVHGLDIGFFVYGYSDQMYTLSFWKT